MRPRGLAAVLTVAGLILFVVAGRVFEPGHVGTYPGEFAGGDPH